jgi:CRISPR-associated protein Csb3
LGREDKPKERAVRLRNGNEELRLSHWADGSSREDFKQVAGRQSTSSILKARLAEIRNLIESNTALSTDPFKVVTPVRKGESTFMFDARAAWTVRDLGYSRDELQFAITASPLVEVLGPAGFEHARPKVDGLSVAYSAWEVLLSPALARVVVGTSDAGIRLRTFRFVRNATGKNGEYKQVTFAKEEMEAARG